MPHRVADFIRSSNENLNNIKATVQRRKSPRSSPSQPRRPSQEGIVRNCSYPSSGDEDNHSTSNTSNTNTNAPNTTAQMPHATYSNPTQPLIRMPELHVSARKDKSGDKEKHHRLSLPSFHLGLGSSSKASKEPPQNPYASLDWKIESPPVVMHGDAENSSGALVSGQLLLAVKDLVLPDGAPFEVESFQASLDVHVVQKRPFSGHCGGCASQKTNLKTWDFLTERTTLPTRTHEFPFSALLEGHLPATTENPLVSIRYEFSAEARCATGPALKLSRAIDVKRSVPVPEVPHHSVRIFPPTNIAASVHYPQVVHPIGANKLTLRLDGIVKHNVDVKSVEYWKLKRINWKLEEIIKTVAPACDKHTPKEQQQLPDSTKKGVPRQADRIIGSGDLFRGWKSDYSPGGTVDMELEFQADPSTRPSCDLKSRDGTEITHQLVVEMIVVNEYAPLANMRNITPTGVARVLRMHFSVVLTERGGLGVSWDNEAPPIYQDVPPSPPSYPMPQGPPPPFWEVGSVEDLLESPPLDRRSSTASSSVSSGGLSAETVEEVDEEE